MDDKRMDLLALLSPGRKHAAEMGSLAADLNVASTEVERLIGQLRARGFQVVHAQGRAWVEWAGWPQAQRAAADYVAHHAD